MNKILNVYKPLGFTPLETISAVRKKFPEYKNEKIGYAGRLDPLADGVLLLMIGDAAKEREKYLGLEKEYEFEVVFGMKTDTYDLLGLVSDDKSSKEIVKETVHLFVNDYKKKIMQMYPPYSSKAVQGKPLFWWARNKKLLEIVIPEREIEIKELELISMKDLPATKFKSIVKQTIQLVQGDFRQKEILETWNTFFKTTGSESFQTASFRLRCSSGTYVRGFVHELGAFLGCGAVTLGIKRIRVGDYSLEQSVHF